MKNINVELGKLPTYSSLKCVKCNRGPSETVLNIEGIIHHHGEAVCIDKKSCKKYSKKSK